MTSSEGPFSPIGALLKFFDPSYSPVATAALGATFAAHYLAFLDEWILPFPLVLLILTWCVVQTFTARICEIRTAKRAKEVGLCIALSALVAIAAILMAARSLEPNDQAFYFVLCGALIQMMVSHLLARMDRKSRFNTDPFHITQFTWTLCGLFAGWVLAAVNQDMAFNPPELEFRLLSIAFALGGLWVCCVLRIFVLAIKAPQIVAELTNT